MTASNRKGGGGILDRLARYNQNGAREGNEGTHEGVNNYT